MKTICDLNDMRALCDLLGWPNEVRLPWKSFRNLLNAGAYCGPDLQHDEQGSFVWFWGVKIRRPLPSGEKIVDLSNETEE